MKLQVTEVTNPKLAELFPADPYADFKIITRTSRHNLQISFLCIQSAFFQRLFTDGIKQVDLSKLDETILTRVLKALYGDELIVQSFTDLTKMYPILEQLEIQQYKQNIMKELVGNFDKYNPIELLEFGYRWGLIRDQVKKHLFESDLQVLEDQKYYLQLNKVSPEVMNQLLNEFAYETQSEDRDAIINSILDSYFGRRKVEPYVYFNEHAKTTQVLKHIWELQHPRIFYDKIPIIESTYQVIKDPVAENVGEDSTIARLEARIAELESLNNTQARQIQQLTKQNDLLRQKLLAAESSRVSEREVFEHSPEGSHGQMTPPPKHITFESSDDEDRVVEFNNTNNSHGTSTIYQPLRPSKPSSGDSTNRQKPKEPESAKLPMNNLYKLSDQRILVPTKQDSDDSADLKIETPNPTKKIATSMEPKTLNTIKSAARKKAKIFERP